MTAAGDDGELVAGPLGDRAELVVEDHLPLDEPEQALEQREVDPLAVEVGVGVAPVQRRGDGEGAHQRGDGVGVGEAGVDGRTVGEPGDVDDAAASPRRPCRSRACCARAVLAPKPVTWR